MRIDEIDLYGNILISGFTGSEGQILTYDTNGSFAWGTASGGIGGPTSSYFKTSGYNYVICETVNTGNPSTDALTNGTNLSNAYALAKTLDVGTKSATNRVVVLLMPGDYDIGQTGQFYLDTSFIDLVGISSNPYDTVLRSSKQFATLFYTVAVDSALKNVHLKQGTNLSVSDAEGAGDGSYLRWENLILEGFLFSDGITFGFSNIYGEFKNIKILDYSYYFVAGANIYGIFENIESVGSNGGGFILAGQATTGSINGTFSNINFNFSGSCFVTSGGSLSGYYENINILDASGTDIFRGYSINGTFKSIKIGGVGINNVFLANSEGDVSGYYENIQISDVVNAFYSVDQNIYGTYKNIEIYSLSSSAFYSSLDISGVFENIKVGGNSSQYFFSANGVFGSLLGSFKNIKIGDVSSSVFSAYSTIDGIFENIKVGNVNNLFTSINGPYLQGTFSNIESGDANTSFYSAGTVSGYFSDIKIVNSVAASYPCFSGDSGLTGTFENIEIGDMPNLNVLSSLGDVSGNFKNIKVGSTSNLFFSTGQYLTGTFDKIEFGLSGYTFYNNTGSILGTYSNIKTSSEVSIIFASNIDLIGTFENIEISNIINTYAFNAQNSLSGTFRNIKLGDLSGIEADVFCSVANLTGNFENIEVGVGGNITFDIFKSNGNNIIGTFSNIKIGDGWNHAFFAASISGYYKDITIGNCSTSIFYSGEISVGTTIDNLYSLTGIDASTSLKGRLINSTIIDSVHVWQLRIDVSVSPMPIVENCKLITNSDGANISIFPVNGPVSDIQVLYTATNEGFYTAGGDSLMTPNYNIVDASLS